MARKCVIHNTYTPFFVLLAGLEPGTSPFSPFLAKRSMISTVEAVSPRYHGVVGGSITNANNKTTKIKSRYGSRKSTHQGGEWAY